MEHVLLQYSKTTSKESLQCDMLGVGFDTQRMEMEPEVDFLS